MPGPDADSIAGRVTRREERKAADVIEMRVAAKDVGVDGSARGREILAEQRQPGPGMENQEMAAATQLDASRVAAVSHRAGTRAGNAAADSPKANRHVRPCRHARLPYPSKTVRMVADPVRLCLGTNMSESGCGLSCRHARDGPVRSRPPRRDSTRRGRGCRRIGGPRRRSRRLAG